MTIKFDKTSIAFMEWLNGVQIVPTSYYPKGTKILMVSFDDFEELRKVHPVPIKDGIIDPFTQEKLT